jgi:hypothetical protein
MQMIERRPEEIPGLIECGYTALNQEVRQDRVDAKTACQVSDNFSITLGFENPFLFHGINEAAIV